MEKDKTMNGEYYTCLLQRTVQEIKNKRENLTKKISSFTRTMHRPTDQQFPTVNSNIRSQYKGVSNRDITISYLYMNAPLNFLNELSISKRYLKSTFSSW